MIRVLLVEYSPEKLFDLAKKEQEKQKKEREAAERSKKLNTARANVINVLNDYVELVYGERIKGKDLVALEEDFKKIENLSTQTIDVNDEKLKNFLMNMLG